MSILAILLILGILCIVGGVVLAALAFLPLGGAHSSEEEELPSDDEPDGQ